jgi:hypothetical protein
VFNEGILAMKFSLLSLLGATAFIALAVAATLDRGALYLNAFASVVMILTAVLVVASIGSKSWTRTMLARVTLGCAAAYLIVPQYARNLDMHLPHQWLCDWIDEVRGTEQAFDFSADRFGRRGAQPFAPASTPYQPGTTQSYGTYTAAAPTGFYPAYPANLWVAQLSCALMFGLAGGTFAKWRSRERPKEAIEEIR